MATAAPGTAPSRRERQRQATLTEIVAVSRDLLRDPSGLSLRAVAQRMGITAPALYRYVDNVQDLVHLVVQDIDAETADLLRKARDTQPDDDPAAQLVITGIAFRRWALAHPQEFGLLFANPLTSRADQEPADQQPADQDLKEQQTGTVFTDLLVAVWRKYDFPVPPLDEIDPAVVATFDDPHVPAKVEQIPEHAKGLLWVFMQAWVALYGTVTLEVFGHCDPRVIQSGALFRAMLAQQAERLGIIGELPRLLPLIDSEMAA